MKLTKMQVGALVSTIKSKVNTDLQLKRKEIFTNYKPSDTYLIISDRLDAIDTLITNVDKIMSKTYPITSDQHHNRCLKFNKENILNNIKNEELKSKYDKLQKYDFDVLYDNIVIMSIDCTNISKLIEKLIEKCKIK